jgi:hypothetical protein
MEDPKLATEGREPTIAINKKSGAEIAPLFLYLNHRRLSYRLPLQRLPCWAQAAAHLFP